MRLVVVFFIITLTYAKRNKTAKGVKVRKTDSAVEELVGRLPPIDVKDRFVPVHFGHIFKEGFDPNRTEPVDGLELDSMYVKDSNLIQQLVQSGFKNILPIINENPSIKDFDNPKDDLYFDKEEDEENLKDRNDTFWHDFVGYHRRNINISPDIKIVPNLKDLVIKRQKYNQIQTPPGTIGGNPSRPKYFRRNTFNLADFRSQNNNTVNWTTCEEFRKKANFHPKDVVNIDWVPFYVWSDDKKKTLSIIHRFRYPTKKLVKEFRDTYSPYINKTIDWEQPKLVLKEEMEMLLIAGDRRGLFDVIPHFDLPKYIPAGEQMPFFQIRMKKVENYLALMICNFNYAEIMAVAGNEPKGHKQSLAKAALLKFRGIGVPVMRYLEQEREAAILEREAKLKREKDKFIFVDN